MSALSAGTHLAPRMSQDVRERTWAVLSGRYDAPGHGAILMAWPDAGRTGGMATLSRGDAPKEIVEADGVLLVRQR